MVQQRNVRVAVTCDHPDHPLEDGLVLGGEDMAEIKRELYRRGWEVQWETHWGWHALCPEHSRTRQVARAQVQSLN